jgi:hypothetical protein
MAGPFGETLGGGEQMCRGIIAFFALLALSGCVSQQYADVPPSPGIEWARSDGQRMSTNPALLAKGTRDKDLCTANASTGNGVDFNAFSACMVQNGYYRRDLAQRP